MTALEKAARAAAVAVGDDPDREGEPITAYIDLARAVLMAVRDMPMSVVEVAAQQAYGPNPLPHEVMNFEGAYVAVLDAILNEGQP